MRGIASVSVWASLAAFGSGCASGPTVSRGAGDTEAARAVVVATVERLFDAMRERDEPAMRAVLADQLAITSVSEQSEPSTILGGPDAFIRSVLGAREVFDERVVGEPLVRIDGRLAIVWTPYTFHRGGTFSHCGYDALHLVRETADSPWRIAAIAYTRRFGDSCDDIAPVELR